MFLKADRRYNVTGKRRHRFEDLGPTGGGGDISKRDIQTAINQADVFSSEITLGIIVRETAFRKR